MLSTGRASKSRSGCSPAADDANGMRVIVDGADAARISASRSGSAASSGRWRATRNQDERQQQWARTAGKRAFLI